MNIAGVLVHAHPDKAEAVAARLAEMPGIEVHQRAADGRMVVTVEEDEGAVKGDGATAGERLLAIQNLEGLLSASLVYHHFETDEEEPAGEPAAKAAETGAGEIEESHDAAVTA